MSLDDFRIEMMQQYSFMATPKRLVDNFNLFADRKSLLYAGGFFALYFVRLLQQSDGFIVGNRARAHGAVRTDKTR